MEVYRKELATVKSELSEIEIELDSLLSRQKTLTQRREELETILKQSSSKCNEDAKFWNSSDFPWSELLKEKLQTIFKIKLFRPLQMEAMNVTMAKKDCLLIMPTGGGKSLCFQLPAAISNGVTLVVSPLVSLMEDQLASLEGLPICAAMLSASINTAEAKEIQDAMTDSSAELSLLYITPEKLAKSRRFMTKLEKMYQMGRFARLVIDEVHCCSQWGHDFRTDYKFLGIMKRQFPEVPILGLTATATVTVLNDVSKILNIKDYHLFRASFNRPNLYYEVREKPSSLKITMDEISQQIQTRFKNQSGIVYCFSKKDCDNVTAQLCQRGIKAGCYHADLSAFDRSRVHKMWLSNQILVIVATIAFGMGIDKPDVRFVIHHSLSKSMENLYQESGRAGRDDQKSYCIVYYRFADVFRQSTMVFTETTGLQKLYSLMSYCIDLSSCRRALIAQHFGEAWDSNHCNGMCDYCDPLKKVTVEKKDISEYCQNVVAILKQAKSVDQRITLLKLMNVWFARGSSLLKVRNMRVPLLSEMNCERIVAHMLEKGYLEEDFHFTPYATISYLIPGPKAAVLQEGIKLRLDFSVDSQRTETKTMNVEPKNRKLMVVNEINSAFSSNPPVMEEQNSKKTPSLINLSEDPVACSSGPHVPEDEVDFQNGDNNRKAKKRKSFVDDPIDFNTSVELLFGE